MRVGLIQGGGIGRSVGQPLVQPIEGEGGPPIEVRRQGQEQAANYKDWFFEGKLLQPAPELGQAEQNGKRSDGKSNIHRRDRCRLECSEIGGSSCLVDYARSGRLAKNLWKIPMGGIRAILNFVKGLR
jgi:hypothetical protein